MADNHPASWQIAPASETSELDKKVFEQVVYRASFGVNEPKDPEELYGVDPLPVDLYNNVPKFRIDRTL